MVTENTTNTIATYPSPHQNVCPACGHCPHCGRGGYQTVPHWYGPVWVAPVGPSLPSPNTTGGFVPVTPTTVT